MTAFIIFKLLIFLGLIAFLGYFFVYKAIWKLYGRKKLKLAGERTSATVVDYKVFKDPTGVRSYYPILRYITRDGEEIIVQSKKMRTRKYEKGKELTVYYLPSEPTRFLITDTVPHVKLAGIIFGLLGIGLLVYEIIETFEAL